jgi:hypothetical protein
MNDPIGRITNEKRTSTSMLCRVRWVGGVATFLALAGIEQKAVNAADEPRLVRATVAGGGGQSSGGPFVIQGTLGQPGTGSSQGGPYQLVAGFWPVAIAVSDPTGPALRIGNERGTFVAWPSNSRGFRLQSTGNLTAPAVWTDVKEAPVMIGNEWRIAVPITGQVQYYRLRADP